MDALCKICNFCGLDITVRVQCLDIHFCFGSCKHKHFIMCFPEAKRNGVKWKMEKRPKGNYSKTVKDSMVKLQSENGKLSATLYTASKVIQLLSQEIAVKLQIHGMVTSNEWF